MLLYFWILAFYPLTNIWWQPCSGFKIVKRAYESIEIHKRSQAACQTASRFSTLSLGPDDPGLFIRLCFSAFCATFLFLLEASWNYFETVRPCWNGKILHLSLAEIQVETGLRLAIEVPELDNSHLWYAVVKTYTTWCIHASVGAFPPVLRGTSVALPRSGSQSFASQLKPVLIRENHVEGGNIRNILFSFKMATWLRLKNRQSFFRSNNLKWPRWDGCGSNFNEWQRKAAHWGRVTGSNRSYGSNTTKHEETRRRSSIFCLQFCSRRCVSSLERRGDQIEWNCWGLPTGLLKMLLWDSSFAGGPPCPCGLATWRGDVREFMRIHGAVEDRPRSVKQSAIGFPGTLLPGQCLAAVWQAAVALVWHLSAWRFPTKCKFWSKSHWQIEETLRQLRHVNSLRWRFHKNSHLWRPWHCSQRRSTFLSLERSKHLAATWPFESCAGCGLKMVEKDNHYWNILKLYDMSATKPAGLWYARLFRNICCCSHSFWCKCTFIKSDSA